MQTKLTNYKLDSYGYSKAYDVKVGTHVCPANGCTKVGTVVEVGPIVSTSYHGGPEWVKVSWGTGKKKGQVEQKDCDSLVDVDRYLAAINKNLRQVTDLLEEAEMMET